MTIEPIEIGALPFYNADVEADGDPPGVAAFKASLRECDGLIIAPPELLVAAAHERFDAELRLTHEATRELMKATLERFARWIRREEAAVETDRALAPASSRNGSPQRRSDSIVNRPR